MTRVSINITDTAIPKDELQQLRTQLASERERIKTASETGYEDPRCSVSLPSDAALFHQSYQLAQRYPETDVLVIVGIGGSNLGTLAVLKAVFGAYYYRRTPRVLFLDTVDPDDVYEVISELQTALSNEEKVLVNVISKSGSTAETIANLSVVLEVFDEFTRPYSECVVATTDEGSKLHTFATEHRIPTLFIPTRVGGRYSVFSPVGIFPLLVAGVDCQHLLQGAQQALEDTISGDDSAADLAAVQYYHAQNGRNISDLFCFAKRLDGVGAWYRQLLAESIGKSPKVGITPTTSIGSTDLHSVAQLYFAGPQDKLHTFITLQEQAPLKGPENSPTGDIVSDVTHVSHNELYHAILEGTKAACRNQSIPFAEISLPDAGARDIGYLLQMYMLQVMYLGALFSVNPFDQPAVELYKKETRAILSR